MNTMGMVALIFALLGAALNLFQPIIDIPIVGKFSLPGALYYAITLGASGAPRSAQMPSLGDIVRAITSGRDNIDIGLLIAIIIAAIIVFSIYVAPLLAVIGGIRSASKGRGHRLLFTSSIICVLYSLFWNIFISYVAGEMRRNSPFNVDEMMQIFRAVFMYNIPFLWAVVYAIAGCCARAARRISETITPPIPAGPTVSALPAPETVSVQTAPQPASARNPEAEEILRSGFAALKASDFERAEQFFNHVFLIEPNNSAAFIGALMAELKAPNAMELVKAPVNLADDELFKEAAKCASPEARKILDRYVQVNRIRQKLSEI